MPEPSGATAAVETPVETPAVTDDHPFWGALEGLLGPDGPDADTPFEAASLTDADLSSDEAITEQTPTVAVAEQTPAGDQPTTDDPDAIAEAAVGDEGGVEVDVEQQQTPQPTEAQRTTGTVTPEEDMQARQAVLEFIGMAQPVDEDGKPTGEEPLFVRLDREAKSESGIGYEDEQKQYAELSQRGAMVGTIYGLARRLAWQEVYGDLIDNDLGFDEATVAKFGGTSAWKGAYRKALEGRVEQRVTEQFQADLTRQREQYEGQIADLNRKLAEQGAAHAGQLERARTTRAPVGAGRPSSGKPFATVVTPTPGGDLTNDLADFFREAEHAGRP